MNKEKNLKSREYNMISIGTKDVSKKKESVIIRKMTTCSECGKESIVSLNFDVKYLKKAVENKKPSMKKKDLDKLFEALANTPPPKSWT